MQTSVLSVSGTEMFFTICADSVSTLFSGGEMYGFKAKNVRTHIEIRIAVKYLFVELFIIISFPPPCADTNI